MTILALLKLVLSLGSYLAKLAGDRQLLDAGEDKAIAENLKAMNHVVKKSIDARRNVNLDADSVRDDKANRD